MRAFFTLTVVLLLGLAVWFYFGYDRSQYSLTTDPSIPAQGEVSLSGTIVCLPHRDPAGPQTEECAYGLLGQDGNHYMLRSAAGIPQTIADYSTGTTIDLRGVFTPGDDAQYVSVGTIETFELTPASNSQTNEASTANSLSDGILTLNVPPDFGLAVTNEQIPRTVTIPPCEPSFQYCLYYSGEIYKGTNFESAGLALGKRTDLALEAACLTTPPVGYTDMQASATSSGNGFVVSRFSPLGDAGAGHYANGEDYRVFTEGQCYEIKTSVGETQFANYPDGTVRKFTEESRNELLERMRSIIRSMIVNQTGVRLTLPTID